MNRTLTAFCLIVFMLLLGGFLILASASGVNGQRIYHNENYFVTRQAIWLAVALVGCFIAASFDYHRWRQIPALTILLYVGVVVLMGAVLLMPAVKGSHRWLVLGPLRLQPSEFAKIFSVIATAVMMDRFGSYIDKFWKGACPVMLVLGILVGLAAVEPDFGATAIIGGAGFLMFLVGGMKFVHMLIMLVAGGLGVGTMLACNANRMNRIIGWMPEWLASLLGYTPEMIAENAAKDVNHQLNMALVAIRKGGITGVGFTESMQKQQYLPEAHTDFIFAIGAEEIGLTFSIIVLVLFMAFFCLGISIARRAPDRLGTLLAYGMTFLISAQALFNIAVVVGLLPTKGLALPFISYGGTNLMTTMIAVGILFNVGRQIELPKPRPRSTISPVFA